VARTAGLDERYLELAPDLLEGVDIDDVKAAYLRAMTPKPKPVVSIAHIHSVRVSVTEAVEELVDELPRFGRVTFRRLTETLVERLEIVVRFLAVLELFKQGFIELDQPAAFGDIEIIWLGSPALGVADLAGIDSYDG
jgi:segregation and condensation protein A